MLLRFSFDVFWVRKSRGSISCIDSSTGSHCLRSTHDQLLCSLGSFSLTLASTPFIFYWDTHDTDEFYVYTIHAELKSAARLRLLIDIGLHAKIELYDQRAPNQVHSKKHLYCRQKILKTQSFHESNHVFLIIKIFMIF